MTIRKLPLRSRLPCVADRGTETWWRSPVSGEFLGLPGAPGVETSLDAARRSACATRLGDSFGSGVEFFVWSLEVFDFVVGEGPAASGYFVDYVVIVGDQEDRAFILLE